MSLRWKLASVNLCSNHDALPIYRHRQDLSANWTKRISGSRRITDSNNLLFRSFHLVEPTAINNPLTVSTKSRSDWNVKLRFLQRESVGVAGRVVFIGSSVRLWK